MGDFIFIQNFHFMRPLWVLVFFAFWWSWRSLSNRDDTLGYWRTLMTPEMLKALTIRGNYQRWLSPQKLSFFIMTLVCLVLMGPTWTQQSSPFSEDKANLVIALDVSESMEQSDVQPTRLLKAKQKVLDLLAKRGDANTALIAYSGSAHIVVPVTNDSHIIRLFLDALDPMIMPSSGKLPERVLPLAQGLLDINNTPGTLLVIGDGATDNTTEKFQEYFSTSTHQLIVWAIGTTGESSMETDSFLIPMQRQQLQNLVIGSGGRLVEMTHDKQDVSQVNRYIEHNLVLGDDASRPWHDSGYILLIIIMPLFLFWFRKGWTLEW